MDFIEQLKKLEQSNVYKKWKNNNKDNYLVHFFYMSGQDMQIGFYNKKTDKITTFEFSKEITVIPEQDPFKKKRKIEKLDLEKVKISFDKALNKAKELQKEKYKNDKPLKEIVILQNIEEGTVYNVTFVTHAFNTLNIKIDSSTGKIVKQELRSLMEMEAS